MSFYEEVKKITEESKKTVEKAAFDRACKEAGDIIDIIKNKVKEEAERGREETIVRIEWGKFKELSVELEGFREKVITEVRNYFKQEGFEIEITDEYGWVYGIYTVYLKWNN